MDKICVPLHEILSKSGAMLFNSIEFLFFLPAVFLVYWLVLKKRLSRNIFIILASYVFYGWWSPVFLLLIFITSVSSFLLGIAIESFRGRAAARIALWSSIILNLGILGVYKYFDFFSQSFAALLRSAGITADAVTLNLILPVGISFYTFQALGYVIDVKRGTIRATRDIAAFLAFISFFPQLVAGPIERASNLLPQFMSRRGFHYGRAVTGMRLILWGLFKKMVVADNCAPVVDGIFDNYTTAGTLNLWAGAFLFTMQIYCDFSGYSDIAIGTARLFGIELMSNFKKPYFSLSVADFWKRWHISLTSWFRDYLYIPLGGNRKGKLKKARNTLIVFLTSGLWHGANFTFIAWGAYHAILFMPSVFRPARSPRESSSIIKSTFAMGTTFLLVMMGWILFRAHHIRDAFNYVAGMFALSPSVVLEGKRALLWSALLLMAEWKGRHCETPLQLLPSGGGSRMVLRRAVYLVLFLVTLIFAGTPGEFIYFQF